MAACMESQADIQECTASAQSGRREVTVCFSPMSMDNTYLSFVVVVEVVVIFRLIRIQQLVYPLTLSFIPD